MRRLVCTFVVRKPEDRFSRAKAHNVPAKKNVFVKREVTIWVIISAKSIRSSIGRFFYIPDRFMKRRLKHLLQFIFSQAYQEPVLFLHMLWLTSNPYSYSSLSDAKMH